MSTLCDFHYIKEGIASLMVTNDFNAADLVYADFVRPKPHEPRTGCIGNKPDRYAYSNRYDSLEAKRVKKGVLDLLCLLSIYSLIKSIKCVLSNMLL